MVSYASKLALYINQQAGFLHVMLPASWSTINCPFCGKFCSNKNARNMDNHTVSSSEKVVVSVFFTCLSTYGIKERSLEVRFQTLMKTFQKQMPDP